MTKQEQFDKAIWENDFNIVESLIIDQEVNPAANNNYAILTSSEQGYYDIVKLLLKDKRVDPSADNNKSILFASRNGHYEIAKLLLADERVDPTKNYLCSLFIFLAFENNHFDIIELLWNDKRIQNLLIKDDPSLYYKLKKMIHLKSNVEYF